MALEKDNPYRNALVALLQSIEEQIPLTEGSYLTIRYHLETEEAVVKFAEWGQIGRRQIAGDGNGNSAGGGPSGKGSNGLKSNGEGNVPLQNNSVNTVDSKSDKKCCG